MSEEVRIKFYDVTECGFYKRGDKFPRFGELPDVLASLEEWVHGRALRDTEVSPNHDGDHATPTYCLDTYRSDHGDYIVTFFLEVPSSDGNIGSVNPDQQVGEVEIRPNPLQNPGDIPGFATYFWFLPNRTQVATVQIERRRRNGRKEMNQYMKDFLQHFAGYEVVEDGATQRHKRILGHRQDHTDPERQPESYFVRFDSELVAAPGLLDEIRERRPEIRRVIRRMEIGVEHGGAQKLGWLMRNLFNIGLADAPDMTKPVRIEQEIDITPTEEELESMITQWREEHQRTQPDDGGDDSNPNDFGVIYTGHQRPRWFSHSLPKASFELNVERDENGFVQLDSLQDELLNHREDIINHAIATEPEPVE